MKTFASSIAAILIAWFKSGSFWEAGVWAFSAFMLFMTLAYLFEFLRSPHALDKDKQDQIEGLKEQVRVLQQQIVESKRVKVIFEISTKIRESTVCLTDPGDTVDWRDATAFLLEAKLFIRYFNDDSEPVRIYGFRLSILNDLTGTEYALNSTFTPPNYRPPDARENHYFLGFMLGAKELTGYYFHQFWLNVPKECALSVNRDSYLRVTLDAGKQDPYSVDLNVPWKAARVGYPAVSTRPSSPQS